MRLRFLAFSIIYRELVYFFHFSYHCFFNSFNAQILDEILKTKKIVFTRLFNPKSTSYATFKTLDRHLPSSEFLLILAYPIIEGGGECKVHMFWDPLPPILAENLWKIDKEL